MGYPKAAGQGQLRAILFADFLTPSCSKPRKKTPRIRGAQQRRENENMTSESYSFLTALNYLADLLCSRSSSCWIFGSFFFQAALAFTFRNQVKAVAFFHFATPQTVYFVFGIRYYFGSAFLSLGASILTLFLIFAGSGKVNKTFVCQRF